MSTVVSCDLMATDRRRLKLLVIEPIALCYWLEIVDKAKTNKEVIGQRNKVNYMHVSQINNVEYSVQLEVKKVTYIIK